MLFEIAVALIFAKLFNLLFEKFKQPGVIGEIIAGILLGPILIGRFSGSRIELFGTNLFTFDLNLVSPEFKQIAFIGTIFLLFIVGLETKTEDIRKSSKDGTVVTLFGVAIPFVFGFCLGFLFNLDVTMSAAIGTIFVATSISVTIRILSELSILSTRVGLTILTADILDDILGIFILSFVIGLGNPFVLFLRVIIFFVLTLGVGLLVVNYLDKRGVTRKAPVAILATGLGVCFLLAAVAENMGVASIIGAFIAGILFKKTLQAHVVVEYMNTIGYTFFIPLFFVWVGAEFDFTFFFTSGMNIFIVGFIVLFVVLALMGKVIGCYLGSRLVKLSKKESLLVGVGMMPRMGITLVIASTEIEMGLFGDPTGIVAQQMLTSALLLVIVSTFISPFLLKKLMIPSFEKNIKKNHH